ncbi:peptidyl-prolyl cis-trans isomerase FKBP4-like [Vespa mandarinia]|uniref:peptidyl-prolyl cis-trans isomerase FKBP4-like n=1 Tax=Vespa mandarinia TaxID=7446 RepID=UPI00160F5346|nr:peptidyl-prolyl cis-trans isomerase FKBP4-like [Vespa mandarinia]XP_035734199.1 peptidyl-prolyl cis-trans isomerase FKBP4-like [Vespa mandarinia]
MDDIWESRDKTIRKEILKKGIFSNKPTECCECQIIIQNVNVTGMNVMDLKNQLQTEILDDTEKTIRIGDANSEIDRKIERGIQMMMIEENCLFTIYMPALSKEGKKVIVTFNIILKYFKPFKTIWNWTPEEKYEIASKYKEVGVKLFKESRHIDAFHKFSKACKILITLEPIPDLELDKSLEKNINTLRIILYNNLAGCHIIRENYEHVIKLCNKILEKDENNIKALYRRGVAYGKLRNIENAVFDLKKVVTLEPHNAAAKEQFLIYNQKLQEANQKCKDMIKRMFQT